MTPPLTVAAISARNTDQNADQSSGHLSRLLIESVTGYAIFMLDADGFISTWSLGAERVKSYRAAEAIGKHFSIFYTPEDRHAGEPEFALHTARALGRYKKEGWRVRKGGERFWASVVIEPVYQNGELIGYAKVTRDITPERQTAQLLESALHNLDIALSHMPQGLALFDRTCSLVLANRRIGELLGISPAEAHPGLHLRDFYRLFSGPDPAGRHYKRFREQAKKGIHHEIANDAGGISTVSMIENVLPDGGLVLTCEDITERRKAELQLWHMAHYDSLTQIPNRILFHEFLKQRVAESKRRNKFALLLIDIDDFKLINEKFGHASGDELLKLVAQRLSQSVRESDFIARLGGDEFAIIETGVLNLDDPDKLASRLAQEFNAPFHLGACEVTITASIGIALAPQDGRDANALLKHADLALHRAKTTGRAHYSFFDSNIDAELEKIRAFKQDLMQALPLGQLCLFSNKLIDLKTNYLAGYEALLRWKHPTRGLISPAEFIPLAEESGLILPIGNWVLRTALSAARTWNTNLKVAVNVSALQLRDPHFYDRLTEMLAEYDVSPERLELEITESIFLENADEEALETLRRVRRYGIKIAIDDFGTGFSSLNYLRRLPFDRLKIDQSFVRDLPADQSSAMLVSAIIGLGKSFAMEVTAEGIETLEQLNFLKAAGCREGQGYYFGKPGPLEPSAPLSLNSVRH